MRRWVMTSLGIARSQMFVGISEGEIYKIFNQRGATGIHS